MKGKVRPFRRLTEFMHWESNNCDKCCRYENKSTNVNNAKCRLAFYLDLASVSYGTISVLTALKIGTKYYNGIDKECVLLDKCNNLNKPLKKYPKKKKIDEKQTNLFNP